MIENTLRTILTIEEVIRDGKSTIQWRYPDDVDAYRICGILDVVKSDLVLHIDIETQKQLGDINETD